MSVKTESTITIDCSPEAVFAVITDVARQPDWSTGVGTIQDLSETPAVLGTSWTQMTKFMGRDMTIHGKVTVYEPGRRFGTQADRPFPATMIWQVEPDGTGSKVTLDVEGEPGGFFGTVAAPLLAKGMRDSFTSDLARLKVYMEKKA